MRKKAMDKTADDEAHAMQHQVVYTVSLVQDNMYVQIIIFNHA